jgi:hypothetical protein
LDAREGLLVRVRDRLGRWLGHASLEGFEAVAAGVLGEVDDRLERIELVMSYASIGKTIQTFKTFI